MESELTIDGFGTKWWKLPNGNLHREGGPAAECANGDKFWYINNKRHREDGPALEDTKGSKRWFLNNIEYTEREYNQKMWFKKLNQLLH